MKLEILAIWLSTSYKVEIDSSHVEIEVVITAARTHAYIKAEEDASYTLQLAGNLSMLYTWNLASGQPSTSGRPPFQPAVEVSSHFRY